MYVSGLCLLFQLLKAVLVILLPLSIHLWLVALEMTAIVTEGCPTLGS